MLLCIYGECLRYMCFFLQRFDTAAMYVGDSEYQGEAPGPFVGLDLNEELYVGAVPDFSRIARAAGFGNGFTGNACLMSRGYGVNIQVAVTMPPAVFG